MLVLGLGAVLGLLAALLSALGVVAVARHQAAAAADLAALAAAGRVLADAVPCALAREVAAEHAATLVGCVVDGETVDVVVTVEPPGALAALGTATARARAGPAGSAPGTAP